MPRASKRVAARQAELNRKKKQQQKTSTRTTVQLQVGTTADPETVGQTALNGESPMAERRPAAPRIPPGGQASFRVPSRVRTGTAAASEPSRRALPQIPYLRPDLITLGAICLVMVIILVVLDLAGL